MSSEPTALSPEVTARWQARFRAPRVSLPDWALEAPHRSLYASDVSGVVEQSAWDRTTDAHRQATDRANGTLIGTLSPDGETIWWFADTDGDEFGVWMTQPFAGGRTASPFPKWGRPTRRAWRSGARWWPSAGPPTTAASCGWLPTAGRRR